jgi:hypothetical protein
MTDLDALLDEQVRYYRERAPEYDAASASRRSSGTPTN